MFNDIAVAAMAAMEEEGIERILVVDLDVHQVSISLILFRASWTFSLSKSFPQGARALSFPGQWHIRHLQW